jgi:ABC-2 type transport system ATP-binding protein
MDCAPIVLLIYTAIPQYCRRIVADGAFSPADPTPLAIHDLTVTYGDRVAVNRLTFQVRPGEIYGLLGSNGAGKSSTIKSIVGLLTPTAGQLRVFGLDPLAEPVPVKRLIGYVPETAVLFDALTPREFLEYVASVRGIDAAAASDRSQNYVRAFQIDAEYDRPIATLSNGTRQKVLLVLDEPLNNLDPRTVRIMRDLLQQYVRDGRRGILFTTHTMEVAEKLCHRVGILDHGELRGEGTLEALRHGVDRGDASLEQIFLSLTEEEEGVRAAVRALGG